MNPTEPRPGRSLDICLVSAAYRPYPSGVSEHVHHLAVALIRRGHRIHILTTNYKLPYEDELQTTRIGRALVLPANRSRFTLPFSPGLPLQVRRFLRAHRFNLVHCHGIFPPEIAYWSALATSLPVVVTFHTFGLLLPALVRGGFRVLFPGLRRRVRARIAVSEAGQSWAEQWFPGRYHVIPNGVDMQTFHPGAATLPGIAELRPYLLFVGRIEQRKGLATLLRALPDVAAALPDIALVVVGSGPLATQSHSLADRLGIERRVRFVGRVTGPDLPGYYAGCEAFVSPALGGEAMGIVLVEALAAGRPVVASDIPGYNEVIQPNRNGLLFPAGDSSALAGLLVRLLKDEPRRRDLGKQALARARDFAWPSVAARVEAVYREVLD